MTKIYLGPNHLRDTFFKSLNTDLVLDVKYESIEEFVSNLKTKDEVDLNNLQLTKFSNAIKDEGFVDEVINIKDELVKFDVDIDSLNIDQELKLILNNINITYNYSLLENDFSNYFILDLTYDLFEEKIINILKQKGANTYSFNTYENKTYKTGVVNPSLEIEAVIQDIINHDYKLSDCAVILCEQANLNLFKSVLYRYKVPNYTYNGNPNKLVNKFISLIDYYLDGNKDNYLKLINSNVVINSNEDINKYLIDNCDLSDTTNQFTKFTNDEDYFIKLEENAEAIRSKYQDIIVNLKNCSSLLQVFDYAYSLLEDSKEKVQINTCLQNFYSKDITKENYPNIKKTLLSLTTKNKYEDALLLSPLNKPIFNKKYLYVLDASSSKFPAFSSFQGVIKEEDFINTNYPKLIDRQNNYLKQLDYLYKAKQTIFITPEVNYDGKSIDESLFIKGEDIKLDIIQNEINFVNKHIIDKDLVNNTLLKNNVLSGSISSFEKYFSCPYSYFLRYVLGLKKPDEKRISPATVGTLLHKVLENLINQKAKKYPSYTKEDILDIVKDDIDNLYHHYPNDKLMIDFTISNFVDALMLEKEFLNISEQESKYNNFKTEYKFNKTLLKHNNYQLDLNGFIDRIDFEDCYFRILDYKSSVHSIKLTEVAKGLQLQLFTYAYMYSLDSNLEPTAVYYIHLNTAKDPNKFYSYSLTKGFELISKDDFEEFIKGQRLSGVSFGVSDGEYLYEGKSSIKDNKDKVAFEKIKEGLNIIYTNLLESIVNGKFEVEPSEGACSLCDFKVICHHNASLYYEKPELYSFKEVKDEDWIFSWTTWSHYHYK